MPVWGEFLPEEERWDAIHYLMQAFMRGRPTPGSVLGNGAVSAEFATLSEDNWLGEGHTISDRRGGELYARYCATCHGSSGRGDGEGAEGGASGGPAAFPGGMELNYVLWCIWDGVAGTMMYPFAAVLSESEMWDLAAHVRRISPIAPSDARGGS
jgi:mono/diheme cytochrome c family protein